MKNSIYVISKNMEYVLFSKQTLHGRPYAGLELEWLHSAPCMTEGKRTISGVRSFVSANPF